MKKVVCELCGNEIDKTTQNKKYCGKPRDIGSCSYAAGLLRTKDWIKKNKKEIKKPNTYYGDNSARNSGFF